MCQTNPILRYSLSASDVSFVVAKPNFLSPSIQAQLKQCQELLADSEQSSEVYLHCLGNAIKRGINLALTLVQQSDSGLGYEANTSSIDLIGSFEGGLHLSQQLLILSPVRRWFAPSERWRGLLHSAKEELLSAYQSVSAVERSETPIVIHFLVVAPTEHVQVNGTSALARHRRVRNFHKPFGDAILLNHSRNEAGRRRPLWLVYGLLAAVLRRRLQQLFQHHRRHSHVSQQRQQTEIAAEAFVEC